MAIIFVSYLTHSDIYRGDVETLKVQARVDNKGKSRYNK